MNDKYANKIEKAKSIYANKVENQKARAEAKAAKDANDAKVASDTEIAERNNELEIKKADLKKISDTKKAEADAAGMHVSP